MNMHMTTLVAALALSGFTSLAVDKGYRGVMAVRRTER